MIRRRVAVLAFFLAPMVAEGQTVPTTVNYQGRLTDNTPGQAPITATLPMTFSLWDSLSGGAQLWIETWNTPGVVITDGIFNVVLGSNGSPLGPSVFSAGTSRYLEITVNGETLSPRQQLGSVGWSMRSDSAGFANDVACVDCVSSSEVDFSYAGSSFKGGPASSLSCTNCVSDSEVSNYLSIYNGRLYAPGGIGDVGIGTGSPGARLDVKGGSIRAEGQLISTEPTLAPLQVSSTVKVTNLNADRVDGYHASSFASAAHSHDGGDITSGTVGEPRIDGAVARDAEVLPLVLASDGSGSTLDADTVDGLDSSQLALSLPYDGSTNDGFSPALGIHHTNVGSGDAIRATTVSSTGRALNVLASHATGSTYGLYAKVDSTSATGVYGWTSATSGSTRAIHGKNDSVSGHAGYFEGRVHMTTDATTGAAVVIDHTQTTVATPALDVTTTGAGAPGIAVSATSTANSRGLIVQASGTNAYGISADATGTGSYGIYATGVDHAGFFGGNVTVTDDLTVNGDVAISGYLTKGGGTFRIDHPLEPETKTLSHSFVESPDMMNVYNGNVRLDRAGEAVVELPSYFMALNRDFRYQLTAIGAPAPSLHVAERIVDGRFRIAGGPAEGEVSWQVTGVRQDRWAQANRVTVEAEKPEDEKGTYIHPELYRAEGSASSW